MFARVVSCRRGVVSIEAAFVLPILITLLLGFMEFGLLIYTYSSMQTAARETTRRIAVNYALPSQASAEVLSRLPSWARTGATVEVTQTAPANAATNVITVRVGMPASGATPVRFFTRMNAGWRLQSVVVMKQEMPL